MNKKTTTSKTPAANAEKETETPGKAETPPKPENRAVASKQVNVRVVAKGPIMTDSGVQEPKAIFACDPREAKRLGSLVAPAGELPKNEEE